MSKLWSNLTQENTWKRPSGFYFRHMPQMPSDRFGKI